jgi:hypothetical protein
MATSNSTQILIDTAKRTVIKRVGIFDTSGGNENLTVVIDPRALSGALNANNLPYQSGNTVASGFANSAFTISRVVYNVDAEVGHLQLKWQGTSADATIFALGVGSGDTNPQYQLPAIPNNATGPTGNVTITTVGTTANAAYTLIIELHKDNRFFDAGWGRDPAAFNYGDYSITPPGGHG